MRPECPKTAANDIAQERLMTPIVLVRLWERTTSLVAAIIIHELEEPGPRVTKAVVPGRVQLIHLTLKHIDCIP